MPYQEKDIKNICLWFFLLDEVNPDWVHILWRGKMGNEIYLGYIYILKPQWIDDKSSALLIYYRIL